MDKSTKVLINSFNLSEENSRIWTNNNNCIQVRNEDGTKRLEPRRLMLTNLREAYTEFKNQHPKVKVGITKFAQLRPLNCRWPGIKGVHISCCCEKHENFKLMCQGLCTAFAETHDHDSECLQDDTNWIELLESPSNLATYFLCDPVKEECQLGLCGDCPSEEKIDNIFKHIDGMEIEYQQWSSEHYSTISTIKLPAETFMELFKMNLSKFIVHDFIYKTQKKYISDLKVKLEQQE